MSSLETLSVLGVVCAGEEAAGRVGEVGFPLIVCNRVGPT
jgi:hypothetical protein